MASTINASTTSTTGLVQTADASGILQLQSDGTTGLTVNANANVTVNTNLFSSNITASGNISTANLTASGNISATNFTSSNNMSTANLTASGNITVAGQALRPLILQTNYSGNTSGINLVFSDLPSWTNRITLTFLGLSTSGTSDVIVRLATASGAVTSGYVGSAITLVGSASPGSSAMSTGFLIRLGGGASAAATRYGTVVLTHAGDNNWIGVVNIGLSNAVYVATGAGSVSLPSVLTEVIITTVNGTDTIADAGSVEILYE